MTSDWYFAYKTSIKINFCFIAGSSLQEWPAQIASDQTRLKLPIEPNETPHQISSRSDKGFRPILNLTDDSYDVKEHETNQTKKKKPPKDVKSNHPSKKRKDGGPEGDTNAKQDNKNNRNSKKVDENRTSFDAKHSSRKEKGSKKATGLQTKNQKITQYDSKERIPKRGIGVSGDVSKTKGESNSVGKKITQDKRIRNKSLLKSHEVDNVDTSQSPAPTVKYPSKESEELDNYSYNRSSTVTLEESKSGRNSAETTDKASQHKAREDQSTWVSGYSFLTKSLRN